MRYRKALLTSASLLLLCEGRAFAQPTASAEVVSDQDIIVTARKRQESILKVPVVVTAISEEKLDRLQVTEMADLPKLVPGLNLGSGILSVGTQVTIRGVGTSSADPGIDQSVSLNIDGLPLSQGLAFNSGLFDLQQIEVLKGPQALFYGKSSPGGVISLRTADPTERFEVMARAGYEAEARQARGELIVSGPVSETLKARLAAMYTRGEGFFYNRAVPVAGTGAVAPERRESQPRGYQIRGTLLWNPVPTFSARLKVNVVGDHATDAELIQLKNCPEGTAPVAGIPYAFIQGEDCKLNRTLHTVYMDPAAFPGIPHNGVPYLENKQQYGTLELNYDISPEVSLTSTTAYYRLRSRSLSNVSHSAGVGAALAFWNRFRRNELTQELRLNTDTGGPINLTIGAFYQDADLNMHVTSQGNSRLGLGATASDGRNSIDVRTYSLFGQVRYKLLPDLELSGGLRWTDETRRQDPFNILTGQAITVRTRRIHAENLAPEFTLNYTPTDDLTLFASYKQGYKSGSFSIATLPRAGIPNDFGDERVRGAEIGIKSRLLDRSLLLNIAAYDYRYRGLQVGASQPSIGGQPIITTINAGSSRTYGVELDAAYRPASMEGLSLNLSVNWNHGRYTVLNNATCWTGQTIALGCDQNRNATSGLFTAQNLSGLPLIRAPEWQGSVGFEYELPMGDGSAIVVGNNNQLSSKYLVMLAKNRPRNDNFQTGFVKTDLSIAVRGPENRWEVALLGKNITNKITASACSPSNHQGGLIYGQSTGAASSGTAGLAEGVCYTDTGRSVWLRLTYRPFQ